MNILNIMSKYLLILFLINILTIASSANERIEKYHHKKTDNLFYIVSTNQSIKVFQSHPNGGLTCFNEDKALINKILKNPDSSLSLENTKIFLKKFMNDIEKCPSLRSLKRTKRTILNRIFPGTKWCGPGNIATHEKDFGEEIETDKCCHEHDRCTEFIKSGETKWHFKNSLSYTLMSCGCDDTFYFCLKEADTQASDRVGKLYFNIVQMQCFQRDTVKLCILWIIPGIWCRKYEYRLGVKIYNSPHWN